MCERWGVTASAASAGGDDAASSGALLPTAMRMSEGVQLDCGDRTRDEVAAAMAARVDAHCASHARDGGCSVHTLDVAPTVGPAFATASPDTPPSGMETGAPTAARPGINRTPADTPPNGLALPLRPLGEEALAAATLDADLAVGGRARRPAASSAAAASTSSASPPAPLAPFDRRLNLVRKKDVRRPRGPALGGPLVELPPSPSASLAPREVFDG